MFRRFTTKMVIVLGAAILLAGGSQAGDLDDNISIDDNINTYDSLGNVETNISFIKLKAKSDAKMRERSAARGLSSGGASGSGEGGNAMNSVVMGAGSNVRGDIIIIDESKGDKTQYSGK